MKRTHDKECPYIVGDHAPCICKKKRETMPKSKNLKMLAEIHAVVMKHSNNRELADAVRAALKWQQQEKEQP